MVLKQKTFRDKEHDKQKGKKRYRERLVETEEAEKEIKEFDWQEPITQLKEEHPTNERN